MYFPYFRGRQYELLALKELASNSLISNKIIPLVEPVKIIPALNNALSAFQKESLPIGFVLNPEVGEFAGNAEAITRIASIANSFSDIIPALMINRNVEKAIELMPNKNVDIENLLVVLTEPDFLPDYDDLREGKWPKYTLCPYERSINRRVTKNAVLFEEHFNKKPRNADYPEDELFSNDHLDYKLDHYIGFGDYSIIGKEYVESGFAPYAVAIHIVYFTDRKSLRIRHFISDSREDTSDVAGKFYEAVSKLYSWYIESHMENQLTYGLKVMLDHYYNKTYPGLPTLKKLSIMHHLELINKYLSGGLF